MRNGQRFDGDELGASNAAGYSEASNEEMAEMISDAAIENAKAAHPMLHVFEAAGLGKAPFTYHGCFAKVGPIRTHNSDGTVTEIGGPGQPMGTCKFCGQGIKYCCEIHSSDGNVFDVGCDCVAKTGDAGLKKVVSEAKREIDREKRAAQGKREVARIAAAIELVQSTPALLAALQAKPHPVARMAEQGHTLASYLQWNFENAGHAGKLRAARTIEKAAKAMEVQS